MLVAVQEMVGNAVSSGPNQYTNLFGIPETRQVMLTSPFLLNWVQHSVV